MAIEDLLDHTCDIYHAVTTTTSRGYGLPDSVSDNISYDDEPDIEAQACHFSVKKGSINIIQGEPQKDMTGELKLTLPIGTDIRLNDKVVDCDSGYEYEAEVPRNIRDHHITVWIRRVHPEAL
ncbi:MAG: YqbH/XkdH family protein [Lachnospiraceae bacterium]|nr:YqbH/XkdH family protein [Lachnospiraceae bacterium]